VKNRIEKGKRKMTREKKQQRPISPILKKAADNEIQIQEEKPRPALARWDGAQSS
jgi:hypothetical protein